MSRNQKPSGKSNFNNLDRDKKLKRVTKPEYHQPKHKNRIFMAEQD